MQVSIEEYKEKYAKDISNIVTRNLLEINSLDYGIEKMEKHALEFTEDKIKEYSKNRKIYVAMLKDTPIATISICNDIYGGEKDYVFLTIFVLPEYHKKGIGRLLINKGEEYVKSIGGERIGIPASIYAHEFYRKLGYFYVNGTTANEHDCIMMYKVIK